MTSPTSRDANSDRLQNLSDQRLHENLLKLKSKESEIIAEILSHLSEVYRRRLFADFGCASLYDYCIRVLKYSNGEAYRKINACKLLNQVPEAKESIANGELTLTNAAQAQNLVSKIQKSSASRESAGSKAVAREIVEKVKNKTSKACEQELVKVAADFGIVEPQPAPSKRSLGIATRVSVNLDSDQLNELKMKLKISCDQELLQRLISEKLAQLAKESEMMLTKEIKPRPHKPGAKPRGISPSKRAIVIKKARGQCENCGTTSNLEIDHRLPVAKGGGNDLANLRALCRSCNQRMAIKQLGVKTMSKYLNGRIPTVKK